MVIYKPKHIKAHTHTHTHTHTYIYIQKHFKVTLDGVIKIYSNSTMYGVNLVTELWEITYHFCQNAFWASLCYFQKDAEPSLRVTLTQRGLQSNIQVRH
jgi:hypothetical protein